MNSTQSSDRSARFKRAFFTQYVSLILIVLTFIMGAFARQGLEEAKIESGSQSPAKTAAEDAPAWLVSRHHYRDLFSGGDINIEKASALAELLRNHDLNAEIEVIEQPSLGLALRRSTGLLRYLLQENVPMHAVSVAVRPAAWGAQLLDSEEELVQASVRWFVSSFTYPNDKEPLELSGALGSQYSRGTRKLVVAKVTGKSAAGGAIFR